MKIKIGTNLINIRKSLPFDFESSNVSLYFVKQPDHVVINQSFFNQQVPNVRRHILELHNGSWIFKQFLPQNHIVSSSFDEDEDFSTLTSKSQNAIFLLLESPHEHEYDNNFNPIAPAQAKTGDNIEKYILEILNKITKLKKLQDGDYDFCLINPVRSQTSLHYLHKAPLNKNRRVRNKVWHILWDDINKNNLLDILNDPTYASRIVINACTYPITHTVSNFLNAQKISFIKTYHPSSWGWQGKRIVK